MIPFPHHPTIHRHRTILQDNLQIMQQLGHRDIVANLLLLSVENHPHSPTPGEKKAAPASGAASPSCALDGQALLPVGRVPYAGIIQFRF
jgi:hypothetical protein